MKQNETFSTFVGDYQLSDKISAIEFWRLCGIRLPHFILMFIKTKYGWNMLWWERWVHNFNVNKHRVWSDKYFRWKYRVDNLLRLNSHKIPSSLTKKKKNVYSYFFFKRWNRNLFVVVSYMIWILYTYQTTLIFKQKTSLFLKRIRKKKILV